ncbi:oxygen-independent coproporphyrinogen III oxidase [Methylovorus mays]|uniref:oxygen-independent coproporphyrinogen III oxidase n=1 Tax=Methylovorus mays TaxID=184077 RepID=UPI001E3944E0|nr:oxygen-independent coproporphyrinogen III oxidase [Methylovorus mays]MCB5207421.1 oxygen-independent coproporphyrinogen III oxidase [Methylovorus mays]
MVIMEFPTSLVHKYSKAAPRYTSYPTALHFHTGFDAAAWQHELQASRNSGRDISLYAHIPFCDTLCYYCGCNMVATRDYSKAERYLEVLLQEMALVADTASADRLVRQMHWGGGTPTYLRPEDLVKLHQAFARRFRMAEDAEIGCEMDPRELTRAHVEALASCGFNRLSLGVQDLDPQVQEAINRIQSQELIEQVYGWIRDAGINSINFDLIIGLPHQTPERFAHTLDAVIAMAPDRLAVFNYAHVPWMKKHQRLIPESALPALDQRLELLRMTLDRLTAAGYVHIGMDHYAKPEDELVRAQQQGTLYRNFQGYTTHKNCDILALGASAISQTENAYAQNTKVLSEYRDAVTAGRLPIERGLHVTPEDQLRRAAITQVMCDLQLDKRAFSSAWGIEFDDYFAASLPQMEEMEQDGLLQLHNECLRVTEAGRLFLRNIAMLFDGRQMEAKSLSSDQVIQVQPRYSNSI